MPARTINLSKLPPAQTTALRLRAERFGMTLDEYVSELIVEDAQLDALAAKKSFVELAKPFRKALSHFSESELDDLARSSKRKAGK